MKHLIGGQAVIEGVMIRGGDYYVVSVRKPDGMIESQEKKIVNSCFVKYIKKIMFIRGLYILFETLKIGIETLNYSANAASAENEKISSKELLLSMVIAFAVAIGVFVVLPYYLTMWMKIENPFGFNIVDGIIKIIFLAVYIFGISFFKDIRRVFEYHGAEHKVVNAYEKDEVLNFENIKKYPTLHLRCGTNFLFLVLFISIFFFVMIPNDYPTIMKIALRIILIPFIAGTAYEIIRLFNKFPDNKFLKMLVFPGLLLQYITTREPDSRQIEVALNSTLRLLEILKNEVK
ncbi:DUF1385 domain-containing protein [Candidatus Dependentiae bacterium]|nr:DUF1385 domain-containing protein [Candidatus Dependentiae bacterium]